MNIQILFKKSVAKYFGLLLLILCIVSNGALAQDPGGNPDGPPPAVPFDDYMLPILLVAGVVFAFFVIKRMNKKAVKA